MESYAVLATALALLAAMVSIGFSVWGLVEVLALKRSIQQPRFSAPAHPQYQATSEEAKQIQAEVAQMFSDTNFEEQLLK